MKHERLIHTCKLAKKSIWAIFKWRPITEVPVSRSIQSLHLHWVYIHITQCVENTWIWQQDLRQLLKNNLINMLILQIYSYEVIEWWSEIFIDVYDDDGIKMWCIDEPLTMHWLQIKTDLCLLDHLRMRNEYECESRKNILPIDSVDGERFFFRKKISWTTNG